MTMKLISRLGSMFSARPPAHPEVRDAQALICAIDRGGLPLNPAKVNAIARRLGLDVSTKAPVTDTIVRIREALARV